MNASLAFATVIYDREIALVAEKKVDGESIIMGVALEQITCHERRSPEHSRCRPVSGNRLGGEMVRRMIEVAKQEHLEKISAILTDDNQVMGHLFKKLGFNMEVSVDNPKLITALLAL
ncbi:MAG: GNAT family N-acetyltransferase [Anaerolineales bacterium]